MKYLFVFAHPDDETVACAGTMKSLIENGDEVYVILATAGDAGEVMLRAQEDLEKYGSVEALRRAELAEVCNHLHITDCLILKHKDGEINNKAVWDALQKDIIDQINIIQPDVVVTFDHTGWYYHLDHVGVSIATTLAYQQSHHRPKALLFSHYQPGGMKWNYVFRPSPVTHQVLIKDIDHKLHAIELHASQDLSTPKQYLSAQHPAAEFYEVVMADNHGKLLFSNHDIFVSAK
jgi:LmbE family N-acetylglucosaminyl deacetylase